MPDARPLVAQKTLQKLNQPSYETLPHPPYSQDLANWLSVLQASRQLLTGDMLHTPRRCQKCLQRLDRLQSTGILWHSNKYTWFMLAKVLILINTVFSKPKICVYIKGKKRNYFPTNLINCLCMYNIIYWRLDKITW